MTLNKIGHRYLVFVKNESGSIVRLVSNGEELAASNGSFYVIVDCLKETNIAVDPSDVATLKVYE